MNRWAGDVTEGGCGPVLSSEHTKGPPPSSSKRRRRNHERFTCVDLSMTMSALQLLDFDPEPTTPTTLEGQTKLAKRAPQLSRDQPLDCATCHSPLPFSQRCLSRSSKSFD